MLITDISEKPNLTLRHKHRHAQRMDRRISKPLVIKASSPVQPIEVFFICHAAEEIQIPDLEVGEELAVVVVAAVVGVKQPIEIGVWVDEFRVGVDEGAGP